MDLFNHQTNPFGGFPPKKDKLEKNELPFIVGDGILYDKRHMLMVLRDLFAVQYEEVSGEKIIRSGRGTIMRVYANSEEPTLILSGRMYINLNSFKYMRMNNFQGSNTVYELVGEFSFIRLIPDDTDIIPFPAVPLETKTPLPMTQVDFFPPDVYYAPPQDEFLSSEDMPPNYPGN